MMADFLADEFWLPSDFLADEDDHFLHEEPTAPETDGGKEEEEEFIAGLSRRLARSSLNHQDVKNHHQQQQQQQEEVLATSPQSTLSGLGSWSMSSNNGSPEGPSQVSSPPSSPFGQKKDEALDLLYAAAGQVVRLGLLHEQERGILGRPRKPIRRPLDPALIRQQLQAAHFYQLKREQLVKQQLALACQRGNTAGSFGPSMDVSSRRHQMLHAGSGMRAVFLNGPGTRRESTGTGVFLPRGVGPTPNEPRRKPACSTVLLPTKVVQALNLDRDEMGVHPRATGAHFERVRYGPTKETVLQHSNSNIVSTASPAEIQLPQEWTY